jgi:dipeptidyl aminopeptidase/acylaminoacyl peptidase
MQKKILGSVKLLAIFLLALSLFACEPISVSVNALGDIAFARAEGVFVQDAKTGKLLTVYWNKSKTAVPVLVRWAPDNETLAFTIKPEKDGQSTEIFITKKGGGLARQLLSVDKIVTQLEWSPGGKYLSAAQQGEDSDLGVADLLLLDAASGLSKVVVRNCGDVHSWLDARTISVVKVASKNAKNSQILTGQLALYRVDSAELSPLLDVRVTTGSGLDASAALRTIAFSALATGPEAKEFIPSRIPKADFEASLDKIYDEAQKTLLSEAYVAGATDFRLKPGLDQAAQDNLYDALSGAGYLNADKSVCYLLKAPEAIPAAGTINGPSPERLDTGPADFVKFSPDGAKLLMKVRTDNGTELGTWSLGDRTYRSLVPDITDKVSASSSSVTVYPAWLGNGGALFFRENRVWGSNGLALTLMSVDLASLKLRNLQPAIDTEVNRQVESRGGY